MNQSIAKDDLEYIREMADAGAHAPLLSGRFLAWWGGVITIAYGLHYLIASGRMGTGPETIGFMWAGTMVVALTGYFVLGALFPRDKPGTSSPGNRADIVWMTAGFSIFAFFMGAIAATMSGTMPPEAFNYSLPLVFAVYACSLMVTGSLARNRVLTTAAWAAIVLVGATTFLALQVEVYLVAMVGVFFCAFVPGILLLKSEPKSVV